MSTIERPRPPRLARTLVAFATEREQRPWLLGDLDELYATTRDASGVSAWTRRR